VHYALTWGGDPEDLRITTSGVASVEDLDAMMREAVADPRWHDGMKILTDHSQTDWAVLGAGDLRRRGAQLGDMADAIGHQQLAFVLGKVLDREIAKTLARFVGSNVGIVAKTFTSLDEARAWLRREPDLADVDFP